ncbi:hypothetical protein Pcinc_000499 [Petrolisthes cinctipes]|uniref:Uncharacterized protein n=1 Tax=Petrolisthes cinctipes TaxID=88211 RepID=A0AAE1GPT3_PETCI|nr:hypothetical protein Pcinc_000499 [Petrolisthes cinctipes]
MFLYAHVTYNINSTCYATLRSRNLQQAPPRACYPTFTSPTTPETMSRRPSLPATHQVHIQITYTCPFLSIVLPTPVLLYPPFFEIVTLCTFPSPRILSFIVPHSSPSSPLFQPMCSLVLLRLSFTTLTHMCSPLCPFPQPPSFRPTPLSALLSSPLSRSIFFIPYPTVSPMAKEYSLAMVSPPLLASITFPRGAILSLTRYFLRFTCPYTQPTHHVPSALALPQVFIQVKDPRPRNTHPNTFTCHHGYSQG